MKQKYRQIIKDWLPPIILRKCNNIIGNGIKFKGTFTSWDDATLKSSGYGSESILEKVKQSALDVKAGRALFERDSVTFHSIQYSMPLITCLLRVATNQNAKLVVMDYGGALGSTYFQNKDMFSELENLSWCIVEQQRFVDCGKEYFEDDILKFFNTIEECATYIQPNVVILSSVLQYLEDPYKVISNITSKNIEYIIIDRTPCHEGKDDVLTIQIVPPGIYEASYPSWIFNCQNLINAINDYDLLYEFGAADGAVKSGGHTAQYKGFFLKKHA